MEREHPYAGIRDTVATHGGLRPTTFTIPAWSTFAVPFAWMLAGSQEAIDNELADPLPPAEEAPFPTAWVFGRARQEALNELFFGRITSGSSLATFYTKSGHPLGDDINRLVIGIGHVAHVGPMLHYASDSDVTQPLWERVVEHTIRPDGSSGFLLPYHDYLAETGDPGEDERRRELLHEIAVVPDRANIASYSYGGELATSDVALGAVVRCLESVRRIRAHGVAPGPWAAREEWLNEQMAALWHDRGAFPGIGAALEALGLRLGTALVFELRAHGALAPDADPWPLVDALLSDRARPPRPSFAGDLAAVGKVWARLSDERRSLLKLLSRFALTPAQAARWFDPRARAGAVRTPVADADILDNPYRIAESDLGDENEYPVTVGSIDRGLLPDDTIAAANPLPPRSAVASGLDWRRVRAGVVAILRRAADSGDALLSRDETLDRLSTLELARPCAVPVDWVAAHEEEFRGEVDVVEVMVDSGEQATVTALQLTELADREAWLAKVVQARASKPVPSLGESWADLLERSVRAADANAVLNSERASTALAEQAEALERITTRRLTALVGRAGTGKTTVLGALLLSKRLKDDGVLFLAPTGKARVRITQKTGVDARTVAQFLYSLDRYDGRRQRPRFDGPGQSRVARTVVIDECSMLTMDDLVAVLRALDLGHVTRIILVGDPNQLPPIGVGRPFADLVAQLDESAEQDDPAGAALARLTTELRTKAGAPSDALRLASWFTREAQPADADEVLSELELGGHFNDLAVHTWSSPDDLRALFDQLLQSELGLPAPGDVRGFNSAMGLTPEGWVPFDDHNGAERFQVLSPVRQHPHGVHDLNRWIQRRYRSQQLHARRALALGDEQIVWGDKVIVVSNGERRGWDFNAREAVRDYLANGEVGFAAKPKNGRYLNIALAQRPGRRYAIYPNQFSGGGGPVELAYALTVHKAQGSEFDVVFVVVPARTRLLSRELLYTAITRARAKLVLLVEGQGPGSLFDLTRPERSETVRRNTNLFHGAVRHGDDLTPFAEHLIHRTTRGELVRSKSELVIANHLHARGLPYRYEAVVEGSVVAGRRRPDFSFVDFAGDTIVWEHLGMLDRPDYRRSWEAKKAWYEANGWVDGHNLFTTADVAGGLDSTRIAEVADQVARAIS